jgi:tetratricopeptide (TPR) repeat protein
MTVAPSQPAHASAKPNHNLPRARNPYFTGRRQVLESIRKSLVGEGDHSPMAIYGGGGIGKTELALEYAFRHQDEYGLIVWLPADEPGALAWNYAQLAERIGVTVGRHSSDLEATREAVRAALSQRNDWLLIFDNAPSPDAVRAYFPEPAGHALITSQNSKWHGAGRSFCLRVMEKGEAAEFLWRRAKRPGDLAAPMLAQALGNLPLALEQSAALIEQTRISCADYLRRFEAYWAELLESGRSEGEYPDAVSMTWELACREVEHANLDAAALLKVMAYLAPSEMTRAFLRKTTATLPPPLGSTFGHSLALDDALNALRRFALIGGNDRSVVVHRFVGALTRDRLSQEHQRNWCEVALDMMQKSFAFDAMNTESWPACAEAFPHALSAADHAQAADVQPGPTSKLLNAVGEYLQTIGQFEQARSVFQRALLLCDRAHGVDNPRRSAIANNLGRVLKRLGDLALARVYFEEALELDQSHYGQQHHHVAEVINNYGTVLYSSGDVQTALQQFEWALEICRDHYGAEHPHVATVTNNVAYARANSGDLDAALDLFTRALTSAQAAVGEHHPLVASIRTNFAIALRLKGQTDAARVELERATAASEAALGPGHADLARNLGHLGAIHQERGDLDTARTHFQRALEIDERALGESHIMLIARLNDLGRCLKSLNDVDGSVACYERAAQILRRSRGAA